MGGYCKFDQKAKLGFITPGNCTSEVPLDDGAEIPKPCPPEFTCYNLGNMIDPADCKKYYTCEKETNAPFAIKSTSTDCPAGKMYDEKSKECSQDYSADKCRKVECTANDVLKAYPESTQYWTKCSEINGAPVLYAGACLDFDLTEVDLTSVSVPPRCTFNCRQLGFFANSQDPTKYFQCAANGLVYELKELACEPGKTFKVHDLGPWFSRCSL